MRSIEEVHNCCTTSCKWRRTNKARDESKYKEHGHVRCEPCWQLEEHKSNHCPEVYGTAPELRHLAHGRPEHGTEAVSAIARVSQGVMSRGTKGKTDNVNRERPNMATVSLTWNSCIILSLPGI